MTTIDSRRQPGRLTENREATYDLIIVHRDRILFHEHYASASERLDRCITQLTCADTFDMIDRSQVLMCLDPFRPGPADLSSTHKRIASSILQPAPVLYSVITDYGTGTGNAVVELFPTREARHASLTERAETLLGRPGLIPEVVLADETRLARLVSTFLTPAMLTLTESALDETDGVYKPSGHLLHIR